MNWLRRLNQNRQHRPGRSPSRRGGRCLPFEALESRALLAHTLIDSPDVNVSQFLGNQDESAITVNPLNPQQMFVSSNHTNGMLAAYSADGGATWLSSAGPGDTAPGDFSIANANDTLPNACCDPTVSWDQFGNLFLGYLDSQATPPLETHLAISTDGGQTFNFLASLGTNTDQPTVTTGPGLGGAGGSVWVTYNEVGVGIVAQGASVTALGVFGAVGAAQTTGVDHFGDIVIGPTGQVVVTGQNDTAVQVATDPDGLGAMPFNAAIVATATNVARFDALPAQPLREIDAEVGLAYDRSGGPFNGRLYMVYTDEQPDESNDMDILLRTSADDGANWSAPVRVNDDVGTTSQFFSKIAVDQTTGNVGFAWLDARNDPAGNTLVELFVTVSDDGGATFSPNLQVADGQTNGTVPATGGQQLGDYIGLAFDSGILVPSWADNSNSTGDNPNGTLQQIDIYVSPVTVLQGALATVVVDDVTQLEGNSGLTDFVFTVALTGTVEEPVTVVYSTVDGTATAPADYIAASGTLTFTLGGPTEMSVTVQVVGDVVTEDNEAFFVVLSNPSNAELGQSQGVGTILNDDVGVSINDILIVEGNTGTKNAVFTVSSFGTTNQTITVGFTTFDSTARAPTDFLPHAGILTLTPTNTTATITVSIVGDNFNEADEEFFVLLKNVVNARIVDGVGTGTIIDNDLLPSLYVNDAFVSTIGEEVVFTVALDNRSGRTVTVHYTTVDDTAIAGESYVAQSGDLTFTPGVSTDQVRVDAPSERFFLDLSAPTNAEIADGRGVGTITFADPPPIEHIVDDGDVGFTAGGGWTNVTNLISYQLDYSHHAAGDGSGTAMWSFVGIPNGTYQVLTRWSHFSNRATNAPYTVYDALGPLGTVRVNQQLAPTGDRVGDITWQSLGSYVIVNRTLRVGLTDAANGYVIADAVRIVSGDAVPQSPEIDVAGFERSIADGDISPRLSDGTDFGTAPPNSSSVTRSFTIHNYGNADLHLTGSARVQITGPHALDFAVTREPDFTVAPGGTTSFDVEFSPSTTGLRTATISIGSDDASESLYDFSIQGTGGTPVVPLVQNTTMPTDVNGDSFTSPVDALLVINAIITASASDNDEPSAMPLTATTSSVSQQPQYYLDVNGDGRVSPHDALLVINRLINPTGAAVAPLAAMGSDPGAPAAMTAVAVDMAIDEARDGEDADDALAIDVAVATGLAMASDESSDGTTLMTAPAFSAAGADEGDEESAIDSLLAALDA